MKNLLIFVDPLKSFNKEHSTLAKVQIDWGLEFWKPEDIILVTNFPYEYNGVRATQVEDDCYYPAFNRATKVPVINRLFEKGLINDYFWFHDFDAFQLASLEVRFDFAITQYGKNTKGSPENKWNAGSFFFKNAHHIFKEIERIMYGYNIDEENALTKMFNDGFKDYDLLDNSYNVHIYNSIENVKVAHFHPFKPHHKKLFEKIIPNKLNKIFKKYDI